ncbi:MAG: hypothetical protein L0Z50_31550, partial [Verrucomicrobiales bacterium]|nr:hypothetical protein [Verrucomicrobiales bacterium]
MNSNRALTALFLVLTVIFAFGLTHLFRLRYEAGDIYPAYSSLRADPLGTKALFQSLERAAALKVQRNLRDLDQLSLPRSTTVFYVALKAEDLSLVEEEEFRQWEDIVLGGGRLVFSFQATRAQSADAKPIEPPQAPPAERDGETGPSENADEFRPRQQRGRRPGRTGEVHGGGAIKPAWPAQRWGFRIAHEELPSDDKGIAGTVQVQRQGDGALPSELVWHSPVVFSRLDEAWRTLYARGAWPVLIERHHGRGTIVLLADSYLLSNEAMRADRQYELLSWLVGGSTSVVFDETHFGVIENPGVIALARKYRLHGLLLGLTLLAGLFIWKNAANFVPGPEAPSAAASGDPVGGRDSTAGFVSMVQRSVA